MRPPAGSREILLEEAKTRILLPSPPDNTATIAMHNLMYGMGRLLHAFREIDLRLEAYFKGSLDFTVTRSAARWGSGFSYGGVLEIEPCNLPVVIPEIRPNTCGTLVGVLLDEFSPSEIVSRVLSLSERKPPGAWDYSRRNHFLNIYRSAATGRQVFILHGCPEELRKDGSDGPGLYIDNSLYWRKKCEKVDSPLGSIRLLLGEAASEFWHNYIRCEVLSKEHRMSTARSIFGSFDLLSNDTHEGMLSPHQYLLGCHAPLDTTTNFPLLTNLGEPAYLIAAPDSGLSPFAPRGHICILPHGTGYTLPISGNLGKVECSDYGTVVYHFCSENGATQVLRDFSNVPYQYRDSAIARSWAEENHFSIKEVLVPEIFTKL